MGLPIHRTYAQDFLRQHETIKSTYKGPELEVQYACLTLVAAAVIVGPDESALQKFSGFSASFIETVARRMHASSLWKGEKSEMNEWGKTHEDFMRALFGHASAAKGVASRVWLGQSLRKDSQRARSNGRSAATYCGPL